MRTAAPPPAFPRPACAAQPATGRRLPNRKHARAAQRPNEADLIGREGVHNPEPARPDPIAALHVPAPVRQELGPSRSSTVRQMTGMAMICGVFARADGRGSASGASPRRPAPRGGGRLARRPDPIGGLGDG